FMLEYCKKRAIVVRFIEYMHNTHAKDSLRGMRSKDILQLINKKYSIQDLGLKEGSPSHIYGLEDGYEFGIIEPHDDSFCKSCDRLRINAEGFLIPCLYFDEAQSIKEAIKQKDYVQTKKILKQVVADKPEKNRWSEDEQRSTRAFYETGG
ncbi:MAG: GTP 3',8-cyclase MoaA, partial [Campylobacterota bacterium]